jgi:hypothetical protein
MKQIAAALSSSEQVSPCMTVESEKIHSNLMSAALEYVATGQQI